MPYTVEGKCVKRKDTGETVKCHESHEEAVAHMRALQANVKHSFAEMSMYITKATKEGKVMKWAAVNSDTDPDLYDERMSLELYKSFIENIKNRSAVPKEFTSLVTSEYWRGGMPYLSISHYPDLNGQAVPGEPAEVYIDGNKLKAKGVLFDSPLGHSVFRSLKDDKLKAPDERIRISIGFIDLAHRHGEGAMFERKGLFDLCPECLQGVGEKVYMKGYLVHLALTRVPVNQRTEMVLEEKSDMAKKTRKEDAESIVGKPLAEELDMKAKGVAQRSDVLIEMSDSDAEDVETVSDGVENTSGDGTGAEKLDTSVKSDVVEKFEDSTMEKVANESPTYVENLPFGGATTMRDAENYVAAKNEAIYLMDMWSVFSNVMWNIMERADVEDKRTAMNVAVDEFKNILTAKAMLVFSQAAPVEDSETHELQPAVDRLLGVIDNSVELDEAGRAEVVNPALQELGTAITEFYQKKSVANEPPAPDKNTLLDDIKNMLQPIADSVKSLSDEVGLLKAKSAAQAVEIKPRIPAPRTPTISPSLIAKSEPAVKPNSLKAIINKSVGLPEQTR